MDPAPALATFEFATPTRIIFGPGKVREVPVIARALGRRFLVVTGSDPTRAAPLRDSLASGGLTTETFAVAGEPTIQRVAEGVARARALAADGIVGFGGGSAIDAAKAIAGMVSNPGDLPDYLEVIGRGSSMTVPALPWIAIPTTAGAGAEVTRNAVLTSPEHQLKVSLRSPLLLARAAVVDPELTLGLPRNVTAATGLDALTQLIEPFVSPRSTPITDLLCLDGIRRAARSLRRAWQDGTDAAARADMAFAALEGGLALANAGLGAVHGLVAPLGGVLGAPHGSLCAALLPAVGQANLNALRSRAPSHPALERYAVVARELTGKLTASPEDGVEWTRALIRDLLVPPLRHWGLSPAQIPGIALQSRSSSSMRANPVELAVPELEAVLQAAW